MQRLACQLSTRKLRNSCRVFWPAGCRGLRYAYCIGVKAAIHDGNELAYLVDENTGDVVAIRDTHTPGEFLIVSGIPGWVNRGN